MPFKLWSEISGDSKNILKPDLGLRPWSDLNLDEKHRIWKYLENYFFNQKPKPYNFYKNFPVGIKYEIALGDSIYYEFYGPGDIEKRNRINKTIIGMNHLYKEKNFASQFLNAGTHYAACSDFARIFNEEHEHTVLELLSLYCKELISERNGNYYATKKDNESQNEYLELKEMWEWADFDSFANCLNDVFADFRLSVYLTRNGFIFKQDEKIITEIYVPVLRIFSNEEWRSVNDILAECFAEYKKTHRKALALVLQKLPLQFKLFCKLKYMVKREKETFPN